jgi:hypothetical protein
VAAIRILGLAVAGVAGCGSQTTTVATPTAAAVTMPLASSLVNAQGAWAIADVGGFSSAVENFWQLFVRPAGASEWTLATPPAVADNGGLVASATTAALFAGFQPSQSLSFSPLATSTDTGKNWAPGVLPAALASVPDAVTIAPSGQKLALLRNGTVDVGTSGGSWTELTSVAALGASAAGRSCGPVGMNAVSFWPNGLKVVAGSCARPGVAGVFSDTNGTWQAAGPVLPGSYRGDQVQVLRLSGTTALLLAGSTLFAAWSDGRQWTVSAPLTGAGAAGKSYDALAVAGSVLTVWRLTAGSWVKVQVMKVPIVPGSSG